ncbi:gpc-2 [Pristionchus pacificus]|uniref:Guanine nucleotide-binding protein subunit gamma n=1 Tax=Pristionchus pacificus TaxID=54126 RepID=A0A2A6B3H6_PRIPA|nr:gpc-2 [Pristionchus pacificus]|eukprot:PDM60418.1 gpc-2 protein [Pristionchus pacificus]
MAPAKYGIVGGGANHSFNGTQKKKKKSSVALPPPPPTRPVPIGRPASPSDSLPPLPLSLVTASSPSSSTAHWKAREMVSSFADPSAEDMDKSDMQRTVDSLRHQLNIERSTISKSAAELRRFTECQQDQDPLVNPVDKRVNPWAEKSKCEIL